MKIKFNLYSTEGCHLCEEALTLCSTVIPIEKIQVVDIIDEETLVNLYRTSIPVLERLNDNKKLYWPFDASQILELL